MSVPGGLTAPDPDFAGVEIEVAWTDSGSRYFGLSILPNGNVSLVTPTGIVRELPAWMLAILVELRICKDKIETLLRSRP